MPDDRSKRKPTKAEIRKRLDLIESLVIDCASVTDIKRYLQEKEGVRLSRRTVERYSELAEQRILKTAESKREHEIKLAKLRLERCFARAISGSKKNVFAAISAQKAINSLLGLNAPKDVDEELNLERLAQMVVVQRKEMELQRGGSIGIYNEMRDLLARYEETGEDAVLLVQDLAQRVRPRKDPPKTNSTKSI